MKAHAPLVATLLTAGAFTQLGFSGCGTCGPCSPKPQRKACAISAECDVKQEAKCPCPLSTKCDAKPMRKDCEVQCDAKGKKRGGCPMTSKQAHKAGYDVVDTEGLKALLDSDKAVTLVDARSDQYDDGRRIGDAQQLAPNASAKQIKAALPDKDAKIVAYCSNKQCPASAKLAKRLVKLGYENVVKYPAGIDGWVKAGHTVAEPE